jgi:hypothetical protein
MALSEARHDMCRAGPTRVKNFAVFDCRTISVSGSKMV